MTFVKRIHAKPSKRFAIFTLALVGILLALITYGIATVFFTKTIVIKDLPAVSYRFLDAPKTPETNEQTRLVQSFATSSLEGKQYFVSPNGNDLQSGSASSTPWQTIQKAVNSARAGDTIFLLPGVYKQDVVTKTNGTAQAPIIIEGAKDAIIQGGGKARVFEVNHNFIVLKGFTIDGLFGDPNTVTGYRDKLLYVQGKGIRSGVMGLRVLGITLKNAAGECLRLRYFAHDNEVADSAIGPCGAADFRFPSDSKNGEGIYLGTSSNQWTDGKNPTADPDGSTHNWIHHNAFNTQGNECVDAKEGSFDNIIEYNTCTGQSDPESGGFDSRGNNNIFRHNEIFDNEGAGVRLGGHTVNGITYGKLNEVYDNILRSNSNGSINIQVVPQGKICNNTLEDNGGNTPKGADKACEAK